MYRFKAARAGGKQLHALLQHARASNWSQYLSGAAKGLTSARLGGDKTPMLHVDWRDGHKSIFLLVWLKDHAPEGYHATTQQRETDTFSIPRGAALSASSTRVEGSELLIEWSGAAAKVGAPLTAFPLSWLREHCMSPAARRLRTEHVANGCGVPRVLWGAELMRIEGNVLRTAPGAPTLSYAEAMAADGSGMAAAMRMLRAYGIVLVTGSPTTMEGTEALATRIGVVRETLYGGMWATSAEGAEEAHNDTAYTNLALGAHTDCTYMIDPPGLQVFNCVAAAPKGGTSTYVDGFAVAAALREQDPEAFEFFTRTPFKYFCHDKDYHLLAAGPVFTLGCGGQVVQVRHNDYDRAPLDHLPYGDIEAFYKHHAKLTELIRAESSILKLRLRPGDMVIADNHRTMHGREAFVGRRRMVGCYISRDDHESRARVCGLEVPPEVL